MVLLAHPAQGAPSVPKSLMPSPSLRFKSASFITLVFLCALSGALSLFGDAHDWALVRLIPSDTTLLSDLGRIFFSSLYHYHWTHFALNWCVVFALWFFLFPPVIWVLWGYILGAVGFFAFWLLISPVRFAFLADLLRIFGAEYTTHYAGISGTLCLWAALFSLVSPKAYKARALSVLVMLSGVLLLDLFELALPNQSSVNLYGEQDVHTFSLAHFLGTFFGLMLGGLVLLFARKKAPLRKKRGFSRSHESLSPHKRF